LAALTEVFFDTSVLLAGTIDMGGASHAPFRLLDAVAEGEIERPLTAWHCCLELFSVATRLPAEYRLRPEVALQVVRDEVLDRFEVHGLPDSSLEPFLTSLAADGVVGGRIYDAHIGEIARLAGSRIVVTDNRRHFTSLLRHGVVVLTSTELAGNL
jgi:hypothetical protein